MLVVLFFFFKQKTAYEMRISDWSSDVCSSDLKRDGAADDQRNLIALPEMPHARAHRGIGDAVGFGELDPGFRGLSLGIEQPEIDDILADRCHVCGLKEGAGVDPEEIGRASCRERVCQYV